MIRSRPISYCLFESSIIGLRYLIVKSDGLLPFWFFTVWDDNTSCLFIYMISLD